MQLVVFIVATSGPIAHPMGVQPQGFQFALDDLSQTSVGANAVFACAPGAHVVSVQRFDANGQVFGPVKSVSFYLATPDEKVLEDSDTVLARECDGELPVVIARGEELSS